MLHKKQTNCELTQIKHSQQYKPNTNRRYQREDNSLLCAHGVLTLWKTNDVDLVKARAAISQWILNTLYL